MRRLEADFVTELYRTGKFVQLQYSTPDTGHILLSSSLRYDPQMIRQGKVINNVHAEFWAGGKFVSILDSDRFVIYKVFATGIWIIHVFCHVLSRISTPFHTTVERRLFALATVRGPFGFVGPALRRKIVFVLINSVRLLVGFSSAAPGTV